MDLVARLQGGDEVAFAAVVAAWSPAMLRLALGFLSTRASAEEIVQEAWLAVIRGLSGFEGRSSLRTWVMTIVANLARTRAARERRTVPWSSLGTEGGGPAASPDDFLPASDPEWPGWWRDEREPSPWPDPESATVAQETRRLLNEALEQLPPRQRVVVTLRDVEGFDSEEVCELLGLSAANQRVLLHRARVKLRAALDAYVRAGGAAR